ncbi:MULTISPECIES: hypothetical protein [Brevundimonas]|uniref:hypothetical protein n=1 Tax=Brevundimonas TaxID=41275 RepID=UPI0025C5A4E6|nr:MULTISPECIES: hypothetical protein [Brevundimonas]
MTTINPSFGRRGSWHLIENAPMAPPDQAARELLDLVERHEHLPSARWPIEPCVVRAMALELAVEVANSQTALSDALVGLLAWAMDLSDVALSDPPAFYEGGWKGGAETADPAAKNLASFLDRQHYQAAGSAMPLLTLRNALVERLGETKAPARSTLRRWRMELPYWDYVTFREGGGDTE